MPPAIVLLGALSSYVATPACVVALRGRNPKSPVLDVVQLLGNLCLVLLGYALLSGRGERVGWPASVR